MRTPLAHGLLALATVVAIASPAHATIPAAERTVLTNLYASTNGASWTNRTNWNGAVGTECTWYGIQCDGTHSHVTYIRLRGNNLAGTLPPLTGLMALQWFDVSTNSLTGSIPSLGGLTALQNFDADENQLTGSIPSLSGLTNLTSFYAGSNNLTGSIPSLSGLTNLNSFSVGGNTLTGTIPSLSGLAALQAFVVDHNQLTGSIPSLSGLTNLTMFSASNNNLSGPIPSLAGLTALQLFYVYNNQLTGTIPSLSGLASLSHFYAYRNQMTGSIPSLGGLTHLTWFDVGTNSLTGTIPSLTGLASLSYFNANGNQLTGSIPSLSGLTSLKTFDAGTNNLTGTIPSLSGLSALQVFIVTGNQLTGSIPSLGGLTSLRWLGVADNQLTGAIPSLGGPTALNVVRFQNNRLTGPVPAAPASLSAGLSNLCGNGLVSSGSPANDAAWAAAQDPAMTAGGNWLACQTLNAPPTCALTATPASLVAGNTATLAASCNPAATSHAWTGGTCTGTSGATCTVSPSATTTYSVVGSNSFGAGAAAIVTVTVAPPVFPMTVTTNIGPTVSSATANIQYRPQDVGTTASVFVFAVAPSTITKSASPANEAPLRIGYAERADGSKDASVACVLAQLNATGQLQAVSSSSLHAYITGVLSAQGQAVAILNGVPTVNIGGATFYVGYGTSPAAMIENGMNRRVVTVPGSLVCKPQAPQTGWWWNPQEGGRGYSIEVAGNNLFMAAYLYDVSGRSTWHVAAGATSIDGSVFNNQLMSFANGVTLTGVYRPNTRLADAGPISLTFDDDSHGTLVWPGGTVALQRYGFGTSGTGTTPLANQPESGWWWGGTADNGRGFFVEWQGNRAFLAGYMYDTAGNATWYAADAPVANAQAFQGTWLQFANGQTLTGAYRAPALINTNVAPVTIQFQGADTALLTLPGGTFPITRYRF